MIDLTTEDWFTITRPNGEVWECACFRKGTEVLPHGVNPKDLLGETVHINGSPYEVKGVEHFAIICANDCEHPFGLAVM